MQTFTVVLRDVPLSQALERLARTTHINLIYDTPLVRDVQVFCVMEDAPVEALIGCMLRGTGLDYYRTSSGTYILAESARGVPRYGRLTGIVVDQATGEPLPHANVLLADASVGTAATEAGLFSFSALPPGPYRMVVTYVGYETKVDSVWIVPGESTREHVTLHAQTLTSEPIIVDGLQQRLPSQGLGQGALSARELATDLGGLGTADVAHSTSSLLGVTLQEPVAALHVQGGAAGEQQVRLDGVPVRSPVTLGHLIGAFSPLAIERLTVHKAGFGVAHGSHLSGRVTAEHALGDANHRHLTVQLDPLSFNGRVQGQWEAAGGLESSVMVAARTSLWEVYHDLSLRRLLQDWHVVDPLLTPVPLGDRDPEELLQHQADVNFSDVHAATRLRLSPFQTLYASAYRGHNEVRSEALIGALGAGSSPGAEALRTRDSYHWTSWIGQARYEGLLGARVLSTLSLYGSWQSLGHGYRAEEMTGPGSEPFSFGPGGPYDGNRISEVALEAGLDYNVAVRHHLSGELKIARVASRALISNDFFRTLTYADEKWQIAGHVQDELSLSLRTTLEAGTRLTYIPDRRTVYAEPRLAVRYDGTHHVLGAYALRLAGGIYRQFVNEFDLGSTGPTAVVPSLRFWLPVDRSHAPPRAYHLAADALFKPTEAWQIDLEGYYKWQPHLLDINYPVLLRAEAGASPLIDQAAFIASSQGRAYGGGIRIRHEGPRLRNMVSYSFSRSLRRFPGRFEGRAEPTPWEQPHRLTLESSVSLTPTFSAWADWRGVWGRSWGFRRAYYDYLAPQSAPGEYAPFDLHDPSEHTLPPLYQLDVGVSYKRAWGDFSVQVQAGLVNALGRRNTFDWSLREGARGYERTARTLPGRHTLISLSVAY